MKTTKSHFEYFKQRVRYWCKCFKITGWRIEFGHIMIENKYAQVHINLLGRVAVFYLNSGEWPHPDTFPLNKAQIDSSARHESIHLLVGHVGCLLTSRFVTKDETDLAEEALIVQLEELLP